MPCKAIILKKKMVLLNILHKSMPIFLLFLFLLLLLIQVKYWFGIMYSDGKRLRNAAPRACPDGGFKGSITTPELTYLFFLQNQIIYYI